MDKKIFMGFAILFLSVVLVGSVFALTSITNCTDLQAMENNLTEDYQLVNNIDCSDTINWNLGSGFLPVSSFSGTLDGQGYNVTDLYINTPFGNAGLFSSLVGHNSTTTPVKNINLLNVSIYSSEQFMGGLTGYIDSGYLSNIKVTGTLYSVGGVVGGIVGDIGGGITIYNSSFEGVITSEGDCASGLATTWDGNPNFINSYAIVNLTGTDNVGGLSCMAESSMIINSYVIGNITGTGNYVGGLVGNNYVAGLVINNSYFIGNVNGNSKVGGLVGFLSGAIYNSYVTGIITGIYGSTDVGGLVGYSEGTIYNSYATGNVIDSNGGYGGSTFYGGLVGYNDGTIDNCSATGLVVAGVDSGGFVGYNAGTITNSYKLGDTNVNLDAGGFIGANDGTVDNCYVIGNMIDGGGTMGGFVGISDGIITNSYVIGNVTTTAEDNIDNIGGFVGGGEGGYYENCSAFGDVYSIGIGTNIGGFAGSLNQYGIINNSHATGNVIGIDAVGGLVGFTEGKIENSYSTGNVTGWQYVGGLVGELHFQYIEAVGSIVNSYSTGNVAGGDFSVGGLVGLSLGTITNSYATGNVNGIWYDIGGLVGRNYEGVINNSYSTGYVTTGGVDTGTMGGLVGRNSGTCTNSYWDIYSSGQLTSACGEGKTTPEMQTQSNFTGWDFGATWSITPTYLPCLQFHCVLYSPPNAPVYSVNADYSVKSYNTAISDAVTGSVTAMQQSTSFFPTFIVLGAMVVLVLLTIIIIKSVRATQLANMEGA